MGILNRVINILILLSAIAAVVFSYMLFSKRNQLTDGWSKMANAITSAASVIDDKSASGTKAAQELTADKLKHTQYAGLDQVLPKLKENTEKIVKQRNDLANSLKRTASTLEIGGVDSKDFKNVTTYSEKDKFLNGKVTEFKRVRDNINNSYIRTANMVGAGININELKDPAKYAAAVQKVDEKVNDMKARRDRYASHIGAVSGTLGIKNPNLGAANYSAELNTAISEVRKYRDTFNTTKNQLAAEKNLTKSLQAQIDSHKATIVKHQEDIRKRQARIDELTRILTDDNKLTVPPKLLNGKDPECYSYVKGKIDYIDKEFGFLTIDIGRKYSFIQKYGIKDNKVDFPLPVGKVITVARSLASEKPVFVGKLMITKVDDYNAICNIVSGNLSDFKVGDEVYFADDDIAAALGKKTETAKK